MPCQEKNGGVGAESILSYLWNEFLVPVFLGPYLIRLAMDAFVGFNFAAVREQMV